MLRRFTSLHLSGAAGCRFLTSYDTKPLSHVDLLRAYPRGAGDAISPHSFAETALIPALEAVESRAAMWRLNRWELRIPALLTGVEKERAQQQLHQIRTHMTEQCDIMEAMHADKEAVMRALSIRDEVELSGKSRAWLQGKVDALRWEGRVAEAKEARDAWVRLEKYGNRDFRLLQRVCAVYSMGRLNTFCDAFSNFVVEDSSTKKLALDSEDVFGKALGLILSSMPTIDICYDFLGLGGDGYTRGLKSYMRHVLLASRYSPESALSSESGGRILFSSPSEVLFDLTQVRPDAHDSGDASHSVGDLLFYSGGRATLISVASNNRHVRPLQMPSRRQLEGLARRLCLTLDIPVDDIKVQFLYLPPSRIDAASLGRIHRVLGLHENLDLLAEKRVVPEWAALYDAELSASESDYVELQKKFPEEEWVML